MEGIFYTLVSLIGLKQNKISAYRNKYMSDNDLVAGLNKDLDSGQQQLAKIKNIKKNIQVELIKHCLPEGFAEFYQYTMGLSHADKPDYDKLVKLFEKGKANIPQYL